MHCSIKRNANENDHPERLGKRSKILKDSTSAAPAFESTAFGSTLANKATAPTSAPRESSALMTLADEPKASTAAVKKKSDLPFHCRQEKGKES